MTTGSAAAMKPYDKFKDRKQALKTGIMESLDALVVLAPDAEIHRRIVREGIEQYDEIVEELVKAKPDLTRMVGSIPPQSGEAHHSKPEVCARCLQILTSTPAQLARYIELAAPSAAWSGWAHELFVTKMRAALRVGDEIVFIQSGAVAVRRADGSTFVVYARG